MNGLSSIVEAARQEGRSLLLESEGFDALRELGFEIPAYRVVDRSTVIDRSLVDLFSGPRIVIKALVPELAHKSEVGALEIVPRETGAVRASVEEMRQRFGELRQFLLQEFVDSSPQIESELLVSWRWDREFGLVVTLGFGGRRAEALTGALSRRRGLSIFSPLLCEQGCLPGLLASALAAELLTSASHGRSEGLALSELADWVAMRTVAVGKPLNEGLLDELEINPVVVAEGKLVALDVLARVGARRAAPSPPRPLAKLDRLLRPRSIGIVGVSRRMNPGHRILRNVLAAGFDAQRTTVIKPGVVEMEGCRCCATIAELPAPVDLLVVAVAASQVNSVVDQVVEHRKAESVILIPGGLETEAQDGSVAARVRATLAGSRSSAWQGPLINGGNCMGIRSQPGSYDTFFLPEYKLPPPSRIDGKVAILSQSGAFLAARLSRLAHLPWRYLISIGNQLDLSVGDYTRFLASDTDLEVLAVYLEGFAPGDGLRFFEASRELYRSGKTVILYRAGRQVAGARAAASHTAAMAGSYRATEALAREAGVLMADCLEDFEDLVLIATRLAGRSLGAGRVAALSNAGFEGVAVFDNLGPLRPAELSESTRQSLRTLFNASGIGSIVKVENPLDVTPMADDACFAEATRLLLGDSGVDLSVVGCVPLTGALETLPGILGSGEEIERRDSIVNRLAELWTRTPKPWVAAVDAGPAYRSMTDRLSAAGVPVLRSADRAARLLGAYYGYRNILGQG